MIVRNVTVEMTCDRKGCEQCFELSGPNMAIYKIRMLAQERGWWSRSRTNGTVTVDYCPEHRPVSRRGPR